TAVGVPHDINAAGSIVLDLCKEVTMLVDDHIRATFPHPVLITGGSTSDDIGAHRGGQLHDSGAHRTAGGGDNHGFTRLQACLANQTDVRRASRMQHRRCRHWIDAVGQRVDSVDRCNDIFGKRSLGPIVAEALGPHTIADAKFLHRSSNRDHGADEIAADNKRQAHCGGKSPGAYEKVDMVDLTGFHSHEYFSSLGLGYWQVPDLNIFNPAGSFDIGS